MTTENQRSDLDLAGLRHDLNNVFQTISEASELISADPQWAAAAAQILRSVESGRRLVTGYTGAKPTSAGLLIAVERAALFLSDFLHHMPGVSVKLESEVPPGLRVRGSSDDWERVLMNLFLNAAQAMSGSGGGELRVSAQVRGALAEIRVQDSGPGIPDSLIPWIFTPRFSTRDLQPGLGLHIVHSILALNGGSVRVENRREPSGAAFILSVPLGAAETTA